MLQDNDILTFGKTVGDGSLSVPPVTARVELMYETPTHFLNINPKTSPDRPAKKQRPYGSGRYGVMDYSGSSDIDSSSSEDVESRHESPMIIADGDSDIEEIESPEKSQASKSWLPPRQDGSFHFGVGTPSSYLSQRPTPPGLHDEEELEYTVDPYSPRLNDSQMDDEFTKLRAHIAEEELTQSILAAQVRFISFASGNLTH